MAISVDDYQRLDATALAAAIRAGDFTAVEVLDTCTALIEQHNPTLNAVIHKCYDKARTQLEQLPVDAPFAGVPLLLKDLGHHLRGMPTTAGNTALRDLHPVSGQDSFFVDKLAAGGFVFPGKTNVPEFGLKGITEPLAFGPAHNPWDTRRSPGGSSGGSAAMVAAGVVPLASANDGGGSIRIPASYCGLVGLKPSRGLVSNGPHYADLWDGLNSDLVLSRSVRDTAGVLELVAGSMPGDPYGPAVTHCADATNLSAGQGGDAPRLRIALDTTPPFEAPVDRAAVHATESMARLLQDLGHRVEVARPEIASDQAIDAFSAIYMSAAAADYEEIRRAVGGRAARRGTEAETRFLVYLGNCLSGAQYVAARRQVNRLNRAFGDFYRDYDLYLTPTTAGVAPGLGSGAASVMDRISSAVIRSLHLGRWVIGSSLLQKTFRDAAALVPFTQLANLSGLPSISLPAFRDEAGGLPLGVMLTGPQGADHQLLRVASEVEAARPWVEYYPFMS